MGWRFPATRAMAAAAVTAMALASSGCAGGDVPEPGSQAGLGCVDDSPACISQRQATLKTLVADPNRAWVKEPPTAHAYASGVRLFAFKSKKKDLTCDELAHGRKEADGAAPALRGPATGLTQAQIARGVMLAGEVGRELTNEFNRRCKKG